MITNAAVSDYRELLHFENKVFRVPFKKIMPKMYKDGKTCAFHHRIIKKNGKIIAAYAAYPTEFVTESGNITAVGIGSVAVSKKHRNEGLMSQMMQYSDEEAIKKDVDFAFLSGYRQRYARMGYVPCGERYVCDITDYYAGHAKTQKSFSFIPLAHAEKYLDSVIGLFNSQRCHFVREKESFGDIVSTWYSRCFVVTDDEKAFCGYIVTDFLSKSISEILLTDCKMLSDVLVSFVREHGKKSIPVTLQPWQKDEIEELRSFGEHFSISSAAMIKFFRFDRAIEIMMNEKLKYAPLPKGTLSVKIEDEILKITVENGKCTVESGERADITLSYEQAVMTLTTHYCDTENPLLSAWSPMCPLSVPNVDMV